MCKSWYQALGTQFFTFDNGRFRVKLDIQEVREKEHDDLLCSYSKKGFCKVYKWKRIRGMDVKYLPKKYKNKL